MHYFIADVPKILPMPLDKSHLMSYTKYVIAKAENTVRDYGFWRGKISFQENCDATMGGAAFSVWKTKAAPANRRPRLIWLWIGQFINC